MKPATIVVIAGVNGAGKSSVAGESIEAAGGAFYNPDAEARHLREANRSLTIEQANAMAWELGRRGLERALRSNEFFAIETTLGARTIPDMLIKGGREGAKIHMLYVGLERVELHLGRVRSRVMAGGHDIPETKIRERYRTSRENLVRLMPHLASLRLYDNSVDADPRRGHVPSPRLLLHVVAGKVRSVVPLIDVPAWAKPIVAAAMT